MIGNNTQKVQAPHAPDVRRVADPAVHGVVLPLRKCSDDHSHAHCITLQLICTLLQRGLLVIAALFVAVHREISNHIEHRVSLQGTRVTVRQVRIIRS